jgi:hypothetical protein
MNTCTEVLISGANVHFDASIVEQYGRDSFCLLHLVHKDKYKS